jgi:hypothetical protein
MHMEEDEDWKVSEACTVSGSVTWLSYQHACHSVYCRNSKRMRKRKRRRRSTKKMTMLAAARTASLGADVSTVEFVSIQ